MKVSVAAYHPNPDRPVVFPGKGRGGLVSMRGKLARVIGKRVVGCRLEGGQFWVARPWWLRRFRFDDLISDDK